MLQLNNLKSLVKKRKRIGRGGSRGGTSTKGTKGQKARSGHSKSRIAFEGGQMPLVRRLPKRGFNNALFQKDTQVINLSELEQFFNAGDVVTKEALQEKGLLKGKKNVTIKILGHGTLSKKLTVHADAFSESAEDAIKKIGGRVEVAKEM